MEMSVLWKWFIAVELVFIINLNQHVAYCDEVGVNCLGSSDPNCNLTKNSENVEIQLLDEIVEKTPTGHSFQIETKAELDFEMQNGDRNPQFRSKRKEEKKKNKKKKNTKPGKNKPEKKKAGKKTGKKAGKKTGKKTGKKMMEATVVDDEEAHDHENMELDEEDEEDLSPSSSTKTTIEHILTSTTTDTPPKPEDLVAAYINQSIMNEHILKQYYLNNSMDNFYPPWTYQGFYSPKDWDKIPSWKFGKKEALKPGMYTGLKRGKSSGISFMQFEGGMNSDNCSNSFFPSPLDIITKNAREEPSFVEFHFINYERLFSFMIFLPEDGTDLLFVKLTHKADITIKPSIDKGATTGTPLLLDRILIHWGETHTEGSEHRINGKSYGMELQFFFNKQITDKQKTQSAATYWNTLESYMIDKDTSVFGKNLLVLSILVEVAPSTEKSPPVGKEYNQGMEYLSMAAKEFWSVRNSQKYRGFKIVKKSISLHDFFHVPVSGLYYSYYGSLTHPPCLNNTRYAVFETPIYIRHEAWRNFLFVPSEFSDTQFVAGNHRPLDQMTLRSNYTGDVVSYKNEEVRLNLSYTVRKSKRGTDAERMLEYDYYEDLNVSRLPSETNHHPSVHQKIQNHQIFLLLTVYYLVMYLSIFSVV